MSPAGLIVALVELYGWLILAYVILSWFSPSGTLFEVYRVIGTIVEPYVGIFRRILPVARVGAGAIDFSPMVAYLVLRIVITPIVIALLG